jgi:hypothetical protein
MPDDERRRALELLASAGDQGVPEELMVNAFVFEFDVIIGLIRDGLATTAVEKTRVGHSTVRVRFSALAQSAVVAMGRLGSDRSRTGHGTGTVDPPQMTHTGLSSPSIGGHGGASPTWPGVAMGFEQFDSLQFSHRIRLLILIEWRPARSPQMVPSGPVGIGVPFSFGVQPGIPKQKKEPARNSFGRQSYEAAVGNWSSFIRTRTRRALSGS